MRTNVIYYFLSAFIFFGLITSCATITVNVYFPAEEVREAYTELEEEFLDESGSDSQIEMDTGTQDEGESGTEMMNDSSKVEPIYSDKPILQSKKIIPLRKKIAFDLAEVAVAAGNIKEQIKKEILKFPDVVKAYKNRDSRKSQINSLLSSGKCGEGNTGLVVERATLNAGDKSLVESENIDRKTIISGMAKAIIIINKVEVTPGNIQNVYPEAAEQFAETRRKQALPGTPVQLPTGKWGKKR
ncbi:MAG: DUF1318 domain-containing protein [Candidatus Dadabacteria bacterium]|nr:DUF1318 domain-containing protein [Candidatus Dadabacteria bacterium]NIQ15251.1 DUF1318 domain-containing protein [Candidatus Dadabacteria bacterium]